MPSKAHGSNSLTLYRDNKADAVRFRIAWDGDGIDSLVISKGPNRDSMKAVAEESNMEALYDLFCAANERGLDGTTPDGRYGSLRIFSSSNPRYAMGIRNHANKIILMLDERQSDSLFKWLAYLSTK